MTGLAKQRDAGKAFFFGVIASEPGLVMAGLWKQMMAGERCIGASANSTRGHL